MRKNIINQQTKELILQLSLLDKNTQTFGLIDMFWINLQVYKRTY